MVRVPEDSPAIMAGPFCSSSPLLVEDSDVVKTRSPVGGVSSGSSNACLNNSSSTVVPPSLEKAKRQHVSSSGSLEDMAPIGPSLIASCPQVAKAVAGSESKRVYMTKSKSLFALVLPIPSATPLDVVDTAGFVSEPPFASGVMELVFMVDLC
ncbi:hypothetical protein Peur_030736 [Populus x canadensis]